MRISSIIILIIILSSEKVESCGPLAVPPLTSQQVVGTDLILNWQSATAWPCSYNIFVEIRCASNPGGAPVLTSLSGCINKPSAATIPYPSAHTIDISSLCPGETYIFRAKESSCGSSSGGSSWTSDFTFVAGGVNAFSVTTSADVSICIGSCTNLTASAVNTCNPSITYSWDNGGGNGSTVSVCPTTTTTYTITASTTTTCGTITATSSVTVTVEFPPVGGTTVAIPDHICEGDSTMVSLNGQIGVIQWQVSSSSPTGPWTNLGAGDTNAFVTPAVFSDLYYQVEVSNICGSDLSTVSTVYAEPFPMMDFTLSDICIYETAQFSNTTTIATGTVASWSWDFGDGATSTAQNSSHQYASPGTYTIDLVATSDYSCTDSVSKIITVHPKPVAGFTTMDVCMNTNAQFADNSSVTSGAITNWIWDFDDIFTSTTQNPSHQYNSFGIFNVSLVIFTDNGCRDTSMQALEIFAEPIADFSATTVCLNAPPTQFTNLSTIGDGTQLAYDWAFGDGNTSTIQNPNNFYLDSGFYNVDLTVTSSANLCDSSITIQVEVYSIPDVGFLADTFSGCAPLTVTFTNNSKNAVSYDWDLGDGTNINDVNPVHVYEDPGVLTFYTISLTATSLNNCVVNLTLIDYIKIWPNPVADFWAGPNPATILYPYIEFLNLSSGDLTVPVTYAWDFGDSTGYLGWDTLHVYNNQDTGTYLVELAVQNAYGCVDTTYDTIVIKPDYILFAPSAFTPNDDGINDVFFPQGIGLGDPAFKFELSILNRWGDLIFKTEDVQKGWDGKGNSGRKLAQQGVYIWVINTQDVTLSRRKHRYVGHVTLLK